MTKKTYGECMKSVCVCMYVRRDRYTRTQNRAEKGRKQTESKGETCKKAIKVKQVRKEWKVSGTIVNQPASQFVSQLVSHLE